MRIGLVLPAVPAYSETFFSNKIKGLVAQGHKVIVFVNNDKSSLDTNYEIKVAPKLSGNGIHVGLFSFFVIIRSFLFHFKASKRLYALDNLEGIGFLQRIKNIISNYHIISESLDWLHFGFGTMVFNRENVAKAIGAKMGVSFRGFDIGIYPLKNPNCYLKLWDKVDKIHVISNDIKELLYKHGFDGRAAVVKITPAIDTGLFSEEAKQFLDGEINFISIARLHWKKGLVSTLEALTLLKKEGICFHYTIIGDGVELERLKFAAYQLNILDQITFTGKIPHESVKEKLTGATIYLQYSVQEGFCNAVLEAQAMGLLCIVSDAEGLPENVIDRETGWVVPKYNVNKLANKMMEVIHLSSEEKKRISTNAQKRVAKNYNIKKQQQEFVDFYEN